MEATGVAEVIPPSGTTTAWWTVLNRLYAHTKKGHQRALQPPETRNWLYPGLRSDIGRKDMILQIPTHCGLMPAVLPILL